MIEFIRPGALWAIPLAAGPWVLHFWGRVRAQPTPFTALDLLREAAQTRFSTERLRYWILLILRTLLLFALVLILSKPGFRGALGSDNVQGIILLDASFSMNASQSGETAFDRARRIAQTIIRSKTTGDRWGLIIFSDRIEKAFSPEIDSQGVVQALENAEPTFRGTSYQVGFAEANKLLNAGGTVLLLSDLAAHGFENETIPWKTVADSVVAVEVISQQPNAGIVSLTPGPVGGNPRAEVLGGGETPVRSWSLRRTGRWVAQGPVKWDRGIGFVTIPSGLGASELALNPDSLSTDDRWFFVSQSEKPFNVCLVNGAPSLSPVGDESYFIRPVLENLASHGIHLVGSSPADLSTKALSENQVIVLLNPPPLPPATVNRLVTFVESGGGLWITAGDRGGVKSLGELLPLSHFSTQEIDENLECSDTGPFAALKGLVWDRVHVDRVVTGDPTPDALTVIRTVRTKKPLLSVLFRGRGRVALWGSTVDRDWTNLPAKPAFPVMVGHLLPWLAGNQGTENPTAYYVGDRIQRNADGDRSLSIRRPDGHVDQLNRVEKEWIYEKTDRPGFYDLQGARNETIAVNVRAEKEGNLTRVAPEMLKARWNAVSARWIAADKASPENVLIELQGQDLTPFLGRLIFVLLFLETVFLFPWRKKK